MQNILWILLLISSLFTNSCATRRKGSDDSSEQQRKAEEGSNLPEGVKPFVSSRPPIDPSTLGTPKMLIQEMDSCENKDGKPDQMISLEVQTENKSMDYFEVQMCPKDSRTCQVSSFATENTVLNPPEPGFYEISIRPCLDKIHSVDPEKNCNEWSRPQLYQVKPDSGQTPALVAKELKIREQMQKICAEMRDEMVIYNSSVEDSNALRKMLEKHLDTIGINACSDLLLSNELRAVEMIAQNHLANASGGGSGGQIVVAAPSAAPIQIINQISENKKGDGRSEIQGWLFIGIGSTGLTYSGIQLLSEFWHTDSKTRAKINSEILLIIKQRNELQLKMNSVEIARLKLFESVLKKRDVVWDENQNVAKFSDYLNRETDSNWKMLGKDLSIWINSRDETPIENLHTILGEAENLKNKGDAEGLNNKLIVLETEINKYWGWRGGYKLDTFESPAKKLYNTLRARTQMDAVLDYNREKINTTSRQTLENAIIADRVKLEAENEKLTKGWSDWITQLATATFKGTAKGVVEGGLVGGKWGVLLGLVLDRWTLGGATLLDYAGTSKLGLPLYGATLAGGIGGLYGGYSGFVEKLGHLQPAKWEQEDLEKLNREGPEGVKARLELAKDLEARVKNLEASAGSIFKKNSYVPDFGEIKAKLAAKTKAGIIPLLGVLTSVYVIGEGERQLKLAGTEEQKALDRFMPNFSRLYQIAENLQIDSSNIQIQLLTGACTNQAK